MQISQVFRRSVLTLLAASMFCAPMVPAQAAMVGTSQVIIDAQRAAERARLVSLLEREDLQRELAALGVDPEQAKQRVAALTDAEVERLSRQIDTLPAGGASAVGILVLLILILIVTDVLGLTDVFTFVHPMK